MGFPFQRHIFFLLNTNNEYIFVASAVSVIFIYITNFLIIRVYLRGKYALTHIQILRNTQYMDLSAITMNKKKPPNFYFTAFDFPGCLLWNYRWCFFFSIDKEKSSSTRINKRGFCNEYKSNISNTIAMLYANTVCVDLLLYPNRKGIVLCKGLRNFPFN